MKTQAAGTRQRSVSSSQQAEGSRRAACATDKECRHSADRRVIALVLLLFVMFVNGAAPLIAQQQRQQTPATEGFVPVDKLPAQEQLPAAPLVMAAYAVAWIAVFAYLFSIWTRLGRVEREIQTVIRRVDAESRR